MCSTNVLYNVCTKYNIHGVCFPTLCQLINRVYFQKTCYAKFVLRDALFIHMTSLIISYDITEETICSICVFEVTVMLSSDLYSRPFMSSIRKLFRNYKINA